MAHHEKRIAKRIDCNKLVHLKGVDAEGRIATGAMGRILNISKSGLKIEVSLPLDTELVFVSTLDQEDKSFGIRSTIVHTNKSPTGGYILGIKFEAPEESCIKFVKAVIRAYYSDDQSQCIDPVGSEHVAESTL